MARQITYSPRQFQQQVDLQGRETNQKRAKPNDTSFISHCTNVKDQVDYDFRYFANYDANMVLPSGSLLHVNYLCFLWHPILSRVRQFVLQHPVHPDDMTVSLVVSQLAGVAPRVYSRRLNHANQQQQRRLLTSTTTTDDERLDSFNNTSIDHDNIMSSLEYERQRHRRLMFSICWDCGSGMTEMKRIWAQLRTQAINSLVQYFGSLNSGSIGWCPVDSKFYNPSKDGRCDPVMATSGSLPWMNPDGSPKSTCPY